MLPVLGEAVGSFRGDTPRTAQNYIQRDGRVGERLQSRDQEQGGDVVASSH